MMFPTVTTSAGIGLGEGEKDHERTSDSSTKDKKKRLGYGKQGALRVKEHAFFKKIDWSLLETGPPKESVSVGVACVCWSCGHVGLPRNAEAVGKAQAVVAHKPRQAGPRRRDWHSKAKAAGPRRQGQDGRIAFFFRR